MLAVNEMSTNYKLVVRPRNWRSTLAWLYYGFTTLQLQNLGM